MRAKVDFSPVAPAVFSSRIRLVMGAVALALSALGAAPAGSSAARPPLLWQVPEAGTAGHSAAEVMNPRAIAVDSSNGHLYVADQGNARIDEFTVWGAFVKAWGWGVRDGAPEAQVCTNESGCQAGLEGGGPGQLDFPTGIAFSEGDLYVFESGSLRVQKFNSEGTFQLMFGRAVDKGPDHAGNLCTAVFITEADSCGAGSAGEGKGEFKSTAFGAPIAVGPEGHIFVGDVGRIEEFDAGGVYLEEVKVSGTVKSLAIDAAGSFYVIRDGENGIHKVTSAGTEVEPAFPVRLPVAVGLDSAGDVYAVGGAGSSLGDRPHLAEFDAAGGMLIPDQEEQEGEKQRTLEGSGYEHFAEEVLGKVGGPTGLATSSACGISGSDIYLADNSAGFALSDVRAFGAAPDPAVCPPAGGAPEVNAQYGVTANPDGAVVKANMNPRSSADTTYYVEYGTAKCSVGGCGLKVPTPPGRFSLGQTVNFPVKSKGVVLTGLHPATTYHFRFVAESSGGGPVFGVAPEGEEASFEAGEEGILKTPALPTPPVADPCPNASLRTGIAALLPDCRAYEMVSPVDKNGGDVFTLLNLANDPASLQQSSSNGEKLTYSTFTAFGDAQSSPYSSQYIASRDEHGWSSHAIAPPRGVPVDGLATVADIEFRAFTPDLCSGWLLHDTDPVLAPGAVEGFPNLYKRNNCGEDTYETVSSTEESPTVPPLLYELELQGTSVDGEVAVFRVNDNLTKNAPNSSDFQCYEAVGGKLRLISILPNGAPSKVNCSLGTNNNNPIGIRTASVSHAVSDGGSSIFWSASAADAGRAQIYARINHKNPTVAVSAGGEALSGMAGAQFWGAAADGSKAIYSVGSMENGEAHLYEFDVSTKATKAIAGKVEGEVGASEDASRIYLVSEEVLSGTNAEGEAPSAEHPNLYFYEAGASGGFTFIATLPHADVLPEAGGQTISPVAIEPSRHISWVNPDGREAAFMSRGSLTGFDNVDANSGERDMEVYRYNAEEQKLLCVSCNAAGVRPSGRALELKSFPSGIWAAAQIPAAETQLYAPRVMSANGRRLFFESYEPLVGRDTNAKQDVYEWEAVGEGNCDEMSPAFSMPNGGCLSLISSGQSPTDSSLVDSSEDGRDVFFSTGSSLLNSDPGQIDIYDARSEGGFPSPPTPTGPCQGESCQGPATAPSSDTAPLSFAFSGPGNLVPVLTGEVTLRKPTAAQLRARKLAAMLKACRAKHGRKRSACEREARKRYGAKTRIKAKHTTKGGK